MARVIASPGRWPFDPRRIHFYYGWVIAIVGTIGAAASIPGQTAGVSVFTTELTTATTLTRFELSIAYLIGTGTSGLLLPIGGKAIDRFGCRVVALVATFGLAGAVYGLSHVGAMSLVTGMVVMSIGFGALRLTGQGLLTLASRTMVAQWFERRRGMVTSSSTAVMSFLLSLAPALFLGMIEVGGFRYAWRVIALGLVAVLAPIVVVLFRMSPETSGLEIDGGRHVERSPGRDAPGAANAAARTAESVGGVTQREAITDVRFWAITLPLIALSSTSTALTFHILDFGAELGIEPDRMVQIFLPIALVSVPVTLVGGWWIDRMSPLTIAGLMAAAQVVMYLSAPGLGTPVFTVLTIVGWGVANGCFSPLTSAAIPRLFGRRHLGSIAGFQMSTMVIGSAVGPALFAFVEQASGTYRMALWVSLTVPVAALLVTAVAIRSPDPVAIGRSAV